MRRQLIVAISFKEGCKDLINAGNLLRADQPLIIVPDNSSAQSTMPAIVVLWVKSALGSFSALTQQILSGPFIGRDGSCD